MIVAPVEAWRPYFVVRLLTGFTDSLQGTFEFPEPFLQAS